MAKKHTLKVNTYTVVMDAVEEGVDWALARAFKYDDKPIDFDNIHDRLAEGLRNEIANALCEVIDFDHK